MAVFLGMRVSLMDCLRLQKYNGIMLVFPITVLRFNAGYVAPPLEICSPLSYKDSSLT